MGFRVNLYSMQKKSNSTELPSGDGLRVTCNTNTQLDLMQPVFPFEITNAQQYNYLYVNEWSRYYWIDKWVWNDGLWLAYCHIDPLASWRTKIGNMTEYILRSYSNWDELIVDTTYPLTSETQITQNFASWRINETDTGCYVIGVVGKQGLTEYYYITDIAAFGAAMFSQTMWENVTADDPGVIEGNIPTFMKAQFNPLQYVTSCMWFPMTIPHATTATQVYFGYFNSGYLAYKIDRKNYRLFIDHCDIAEHPQTPRGLYLNIAPYTRMRLSALPWGEVDLDTTKFWQSDAIYLEAWLDPVSGSSKLYVQNMNGQNILVLVGQLGVPEQLSQVLKDNLATVTGAGQAALGVVGTLFSATPQGTMGSIASIANGIGSAVAAQYPDVSTTGTNGARIAVCPTAIWLTQTFQMIVGEDRQNHGRPLCQRQRIRDIPGYIMVADPDVELPATQAEIDQIKEYMVNGFFYE